MLSPFSTGDEKNKTCKRNKRGQKKSMKKHEKLIKENYSFKLTLSQPKNDPSYLSYMHGLPLRLESQLDLHTCCQPLVPVNGHHR